MSAFIVDLWESIFTPGPTTTLLKATNATFAALQVVLLLLLYGTCSIHFVVLSILCAGLWWSINWFATELVIVQQRQKEQEKEESKKRRREKQQQDGSDTEVENTATTSSKNVTGRNKRSAGEDNTAAVAVAATEVEPVQRLGDLKHRGEQQHLLGIHSSVSTEDEWEKVSENEQEKDK